MLKLRKLFTWHDATILAAAIVLWHVFAGMVFVFSPTANNDYTPDSYERMTAAEFANMALGGDNGVVVLPISPDAPWIGDKRVVRFIGISESQSEPYAILEVWMDDKPFHAYVPYDDVVWTPGNAETITMAFDDVEVEALYTGKGYNYWRFMTFRGANKLAYDPHSGYDGNGFTYMNPARAIEEHATSIVIVAPDDDYDWNHARKIG